MRIININNHTILFKGNTPVRVLSKHECELLNIVRSTSHRVRHMPSLELLDFYLMALSKGAIEDVIVAKTEILDRMDKCPVPKDKLAEDLYKSFKSEL